MKIRKLVKSGYSSLVLAVPKEWVKRNKLKAGDMVYIQDESEKLKISTTFKEQAVEKRTIVINVDGKSEASIVHEITSAYLDNFFHIIIKGKELPRVIKEVKKLIIHLVALELVEESSDRVVARSFLNIYDADLKLLIRRIDNIVRSMMLDVEEAVKNHDLVQTIVERDHEVNRLSFLVLKLLKAAYLDKRTLTSLKLEELDILRYWELNIHLEKIADRTKNIASIIPKLNVQRKKNFMQLFSELETLYKDAMKAFYKLSIQESDKISIKRMKTLSNIQNYIKNNECAVCSQVAINAFNMVGNINDICRVVRYLG